MKLIIDIDDEMYKRICEAQSVPDMYGTDVVNAINRIKKGTLVSTEIATKLQPNCNKLQGEWTPISEGLPESRDWYLGLFKEPDTDFIGIPYICDYVGTVTKGTTNEGWILRHCTDVDTVPDYFRNLICVAWQPLPKPYREDSTEKVKIKSTKDLINNIAGFDVSGIKPLPEYPDGITDAEQKEVKNNVD